MLRAMVAILVALLPIAASASDALTFRPLPRSVNVNGVQVSVPIRFELVQASLADGAKLTVRVVADLSDLTAKIDQIINTIPLPQDNCKNYSPNNPVVSLGRKSLIFQDGAAMLSISGNVDMWACLENPVPNSKVEMRTKNIGLGVKTKVPVVVTWPGDPIKTRLGSQPFDAALPITLVKNDDQSLRLQLGRPDIDLGGQYVFITKGILTIAGVDINAQAGAALQQAIDPDSLRLLIPKFEGFDPVVEDAHFIADNGHLAAEVVVTAAVSPAAVLTVVPRLTALLGRP